MPNSTQLLMFLIETLVASFFAFFGVLHDGATSSDGVGRECLL
jgi:hypothetical protein